MKLRRFAGLLAFCLASTALYGADTPGTPAASTHPKQAAASEPSRVDALGDPLPDGARLRLGTLRYRPPASVADLALTPDESAVVTAGTHLIVWDTATGKERWRADDADLEYRGAAYGTRAVAFAADGSQFYTPGNRDQFVVWETNTGRREVVTIKRRPRGLRQARAFMCSIDVTRDATKFAVGGDGGIVICDRAGQVLHEFVNAPAGAAVHDNNDRLSFAGHYSTARFSPDGKTVAVVTSDRPQEVRLYDAETGREVKTIALSSRLVRMAWSPDGRQLAATERDSAVRLYDLETGRPIWSHIVELNNRFENYTSAVGFSPDGKLVATGATDYRIYLLDAATGDETARLSGHFWYPWTVAFTADSRMLYSSGWDGAVRRWDLPSHRQLPLPAGIRASEVVAASPDGRTLAYHDDYGVIRLVEIEKGGERRTFELPGTRYTQVLFSPDGACLAAGGTQGDQVHLAVWDVASGELLHRWDWPKGRDPHSHVESLSFTPDGSRLAAAVFRQSAAYIWNLATGEQVARLAHKEVYGLSFSPDGTTLATAGWDKVICFWETETGKMHRQFSVADGANVGNDLRMYTVCYAPEGGLLATAHLDGSVQVWEPGTMARVSRFAVKGRFVYGAMAFSPDGLWLATGAMDGTVTLWDPSTGTPIVEPGKHQHYVYTVGFGSNTRTLASGGDDGVCYVWDMHPHQAHPSDDLAALWNDLGGSDGKTAYAALWKLAEMPDRSVAFVTEKLRPVRRLIDVESVGEGVTGEDAERRKRFNKLLADRDASVEIAIAVRRAIAVLAQIDAPAAQGALRELAARNPRGEVGELAAQALLRIRALAGDESR